MPSDFQSFTIILHTRRAYLCDWCGTLIDAGSTATSVRGKYDGSFYAWHVHMDCDEAWRRDECNTYGEACPYDHRRGMTCAETDEAQMREQEEKHVE